MRRALVVEQPGSIGLAEREELAPGPGEVVVRVAYCGLCGTDLELLRGEVDPAFVRYPLTLGHEWSGIVEAVGDGVELEPGARCVAEGIIPCGHCASCRVGATNVCETYDEVGFTREGGASDQILVPARVVHVLDDAVPLLDAALVEPASVVLTGLEKVRPRPGLRVLVVGDGTIALLAVLLVGLMSPAEIVVAGRRAGAGRARARAGRDRLHDGRAAGRLRPRDRGGRRDGSRPHRPELGPAGRRRPEPRPAAVRRGARAARRHARQQRPHARRQLRLHLGRLGARRLAPEREASPARPARHAPLRARPTSRRRSPSSPSRAACAAR